MSIASVGSRPTFNPEEMKARFESFRNGQSNISKKELEDLESKAKASGMRRPEGAPDLLKDFDKIDGNGDGISFKELQSYAKSKGLPELPSEPPRPGTGYGAPQASSSEDLLKLLTGGSEDEEEESSSSSRSISALIQRYASGAAGSGFENYRLESLIDSV